MCHCDPMKRTPCCGPDCHPGELPCCSLRQRPAATMDEPTKLSDVKPKPNEYVVECLTRLLEEAKEGDIMGFVYFSLLQRRRWDRGSVGIIDTQAAISGTALMHREALDVAAAGSDEDDI